MENNFRHLLSSMQGPCRLCNKVSVQSNSPAHLHWFLSLHSNNVYSLYIRTPNNSCPRPQHPMLVPFSMFCSLTWNSNTGVCNSNVPHNDSSLIISDPHYSPAHKICSPLNTQPQHPHSDLILDRPCSNSGTDTSSKTSLPPSPLSSQFSHWPLPLRHPSY